MENNKFHTFNTDMNKKITASMEDYIEMIYRLSKDTGYTRIYELASMLNIKPSSATKMVQKLSDIGYLKYQKYGVIVLKKTGYELGKKLLNRHNAIEKLLKILNINENNILYETEKIEHTISEDTLKCIDKFVNFVNNNEIIQNELKKI